MVEALDEVQSAVLGVMQLVAQDRHRFVERDVFLAAETTHRTLNASACLAGRRPTTAAKWTPLFAVHSKLYCPP